MKKIIDKIDFKQIINSTIKLNIKLQEYNNCLSLNNPNIRESILLSLFKVKDIYFGYSRYYRYDNLNKKNNIIDIYKFNSGIFDVKCTKYDKVFEVYNSNKLEQIIESENLSMAILEFLKSLNKAIFELEIFNKINKIDVANIPSTLKIGLIFILLIEVTNKNIKLSSIITSCLFKRYKLTKLNNIYILDKVIENEATIFSKIDLIKTSIISYNYRYKKLSQNTTEILTELINLFNYICIEEIVFQLNVVSEIIKLKNSTIKKVSLIRKSNDDKLNVLIDYILANPIFNKKYISDNLDIKSVTLNRYINILDDIKFLKREEKNRRKHKIDYYCNHVISILLNEEI